MISKLKKERKMIWTIVMDLRLKYKKGQNMRARLWLRNQKNVKTIARFWIRKSKIQKRILWFRCMIMRALGLLVVVSKSSLLISTTFIILLKGVRVITVGLGLKIQLPNFSMVVLFLQPEFGFLLGFQSQIHHGKSYAK